MYKCWYLNVNVLSFNFKKIIINKCNCPTPQYDYVPWGGVYMQIRSPHQPLTHEIASITEGLTNMKKESLLCELSRANENFRLINYFLLRLKKTLKWRVFISFQLTMSSYFHDSHPTTHKNSSIISILAHTFFF